MDDGGPPSFPSSFLRVSAGRDSVRARILSVLGARSGNFIESPESSNRLSLLQGLLPIAPPSMLRLPVEPALETKAAEGGRERSQIREVAASLRIHSSYINVLCPRMRLMQLEPMRPTWPPHEILSGV